jgi:hypothetical protein
LLKVAVAATLGLICAAAGYAFYEAATAPKPWERPRVIVCPIRDPGGNLDELRLACRRNLGLPSSGPDAKQQSKAIWVEQSGAELACVLDCVAQSKSSR